jgi:hypothetical protein
LFTLDTFTREFEGKPLATIVWQGRPMWIARHIGALLGYAGHGERLVHRVLGEWNAELEEGEDYLFLDGVPLSALRSLGREEIEPDPRASVLVLLGSGLHLVLSKTEGPVEAGIRRFLVEEVLRKVPRERHRRTWRPELDLGVSEADARLWTRPSIAPETPLVLQPTLSEQREERAKLQTRTEALWLDLFDRYLRAQALHRVRETLGSTLTAGACAALEIHAAELVTGLNIESLLDGSDLSPRAA